MTLRRALGSIPVLAFLGIALVAPGCGTADDAPSASEDDLTGLNVAEGSPEALGILKLANTASVDLLHTGVGLVTKTAKNIFAHRVGPDGKAGTADDDPFGSLKELDAVPYVGKAAFQKLLAYAKAHGYVTVDPFDPASCAGPPITKQHAVALFAAGTTETIVGTYVIEKRSRSCNSVTDCGAWGPPVTALGSSLGSLSPDAEMTGQVLLQVEGTDITVRLDDGSAGGSDGCSCSSAGQPQSCTPYVYIAGYQWGGSGGEYPTYSKIIKADNKPLALSGSLTASCLRLTDSAKTADQEEQYVLLAKLTDGSPPPKSDCPFNSHRMACGSQAAGATTCCQSGLTTCPQSGCDCWGACQ